MNVQFHCMIEKASVEEEKKEFFPYKRLTTQYEWNIERELVVTPILYLSTFLHVYFIKVFSLWGNFYFDCITEKNKPLFRNK